MLNITLVTYASAACAYTVLAALLIPHLRSNSLAPTLLVACIITVAWALSIALGTLLVFAPILTIQVVELLRNLSWLFAVMQLFALQNSDVYWRIGTRKWVMPFFVVGALALAAVSFRPLIESIRIPIADTYYSALLCIWLLLALAGLLVIEQLYRNATPGERWSLKFVCFPIGALFAYDFFMYSEALLFGNLDSELWKARGLVAAIATPWLAVGIARNRNWQVNLHVSRHVVFHTVTLMGAGVYLLMMSIVGYFIKYLGGSWGGVLQLAFLAAAFALLGSILFSGRLRARLRVWLSKHFFSYRYDYREEWLKFTNTLARLHDDVPEGILRSVAHLATSPAGLLYGTSEGSRTALLAHWQMPSPEEDAGLDRVSDWMQCNGWIIDLIEWRRSPDLYKELDMPEWLGRSQDLWLLIPLTFREQLLGIVMLRRSSLKTHLNWEDRDLLKTAGRQAASHLAQYLAREALLEARQFAAFNRLSAYVVHDLKNILAQQSLLLANAEKHRDNPAFIEDMIDTVRHSVARMHRLMEQMRSGERNRPQTVIDVIPLIREAVLSQSAVNPVPIIELPNMPCIVRADRDRLATVFTHLIQNAQEATPEHGKVVVCVATVDDVVVASIVDTGCGMDSEFVRKRLFKPFESTKGLTGMGIGAFESREYVRQLGGDIEVQSVPGTGSTFTVTLPRHFEESVEGIEAEASA